MTVGSLSKENDTNALRPSQNEHLCRVREADLRLRILIVGCGLGGMAAAHCLARAGHDIVILESESVLEEEGAGLQVSPNASRLLTRWGLANKLAEVAVEPQGVAFRRYENGELVGYARWGSVMRQMHGAPNYHVHRADLHKLLLDLISTSPRIKLRLDARVVDMNPVPDPQVSVRLATGETVIGDIIIGSDGVKSMVRSIVLGYPDRAEPTGDVAYRTVIPADWIRDDPELKSLIETPEITAWMGPKKHMIGYCIRAKGEYNMAMVHQEGFTEEPWSPETDPDKLRLTFADFEPRVRKLLSHVTSTLRWRLTDHDPLERWIHPAGRVVLLGDACHPMLPYRAQGAAMAFEDAAVLGSLLSRLSSLAQLPRLLYAYESIRRPRATKTQLASRMNQYIFHLPDGPEQEQRDSQMRSAMKFELEQACLEKSPGLDQLNEGNANQWADKQKNIEQFSYDADAAADFWLAENGEISYN
ncbi:FAD/NAD-binding domain-containing protein [Fomitiporia mediterranea MF3/22]|uniref:FAD/NAD-binding domain-containing protein n=1 Tax=Fomitiporia mediterranea (strain MF3/22) TaxID=694068 RepID=UPI000440743E|nr:FAD/NAD-binding domain-containing protein [Fomitiporia mediterranea MF3/22]EJC99727.1 FAD/NAD-binding domain-containing protein [Fomitiporia mediterranea MF3/22]